ncbi:hypothetical protein ACFX11_030051 [Malus domestica]
METSAKEEAKKMRKMLPNFIKPEALQPYIGIMDTVAQRHFADGWENKKEVEVFPLAKNYTFWLAARLFVSLDDSVEIARLGDPFVVLAFGIIDASGFPGNSVLQSDQGIQLHQGGADDDHQAEEDRLGGGSGIMKPLVELMANFGSNMVDKSAYVLSILVSVLETCAALVEEGKIPVLVEIVEMGSQQQKEISVAILLKLCENSGVHRNMVVREGAIPPIVTLSQSDTNCAKQMAETLTELLRQPKSGNGAARPSDVSL